MRWMSWLDVTQTRTKMVGKCKFSGRTGEDRTLILQSETLILPVKCESGKLLMFFSLIVLLT